MLSFDLKIPLKKIREITKKRGAEYSEEEILDALQMLMRFCQNKVIRDIPKIDFYDFCMDLMGTQSDEEMILNLIEMYDFGLKDPYILLDTLNDYDMLRDFVNFVYEYALKRDFNYIEVLNDVVDNYKNIVEKRGDYVLGLYKIEKVESHII